MFGCTTSQSETDQIKHDLIGQTMGGRESSWKFQSVDQIKKFTINKTFNDAYIKSYTISMTLHDDRVLPFYDTDAIIGYEKVDNQWKIKYVGLLKIVQLTSKNI